MCVCNIIIPETWNMAGFLCYLVIIVELINPLIEICDYVNQFRLACIHNKVDI